MLPKFLSIFFAYRLINVINVNNLFTPHVAIKIAEDQVKANQHRVTAFNLQRGIYEVLTRSASGGL